MLMNSGDARRGYRVPYLWYGVKLRVAAPYSVYNGPEGASSHRAYLPSPHPHPHLTGRGKEGGIWMRAGEIGG